MIRNETCAKMCQKGRQVAKGRQKEREVETREAARGGMYVRIEYKEDAMRAPPAALVCSDGNSSSQDMISWQISFRRTGRSWSVLVGIYWITIPCSLLAGSLRDRVNGGSMDQVP